jgi:hypothetical protein
VKQELKKYDFAILLHLIDWKSSVGKFKIAENTYLCDFKDSKVRKLYYEMCEEKGIDDGEPFTFDSYVLFENSNGIFNSKWPAPYSTKIVQVCNVIALCLGSSIGLYRTISSYDQFDTAILSEVEFIRGPL